MVHLSYVCGMFVKPMKQILNLIFFLCVLSFVSCQDERSKASPLELMVNDYVEKQFPNWSDSIRSKEDTLYLHVYFSHYVDNFSTHITDSTAVLDVVASVGGTVNRMVYPEYILEPPLPALLPGETISDAHIEQFVQAIKSAELEIYGKEAVAPDFSDNQKKIKYYDGRWVDLHHAIDSLNLLDPALIGYTYFGPVQVIILAKRDVDQNLLSPFLKGVNVMDLRPRYIWHKKNEKEQDCSGWGAFNVYSIESAGHFHQIGHCLIE